MAGLNHVATVIFLSWRLRNGFWKQKQASVKENCKESNKIQAQKIKINQNGQERNFLYN